MFKAVLYVYDKVTDRIPFILNVSVFLIMLLTCCQVLGRLIFGITILWSTEVSIFMLILLTFLGASWLLKNDLHVNMDIVINLLSIKNKALINFFTSILGLIISLLITWNGFSTTYEQCVRGVILQSIIKLPKFILIVIIPISTLFLSIEFIRKIGFYYKEMRNGLSTAEISEENKVGL